MPVRVAIISNAVTPYRINLHLRIARECPSIEVWSLFTHEYSNAPWQLRAPDEIRPVFFGQGEASENQSFARKPLGELRKARTIEQQLRVTSIDAIVLFGYNDWCRLHLIAWCRVNRVPCFIFGDSNSLNEKGAKTLVKRMFLPLLLSLTSGAMYCGTRGLEYFALYGVSPKRLFPFPYEPDYLRVSSVPDEARNRIMEQFGLPPMRRRIVFSGRLATVKRVDLLVRAFHRIAESRPEWDLVIAGDGPERVKLQDAISLPLRERVTFLGFINNPETLAAVYAASDVLVLPSDFEPWGVVVTEAATRLALICSSLVGAAIDLVVPSRNGQIFDAGNEEALAAALLEVTQPSAIGQMKAESANVLAEWRRRADPVAGLRAALRSVGLLEPVT